MSPQIRQEIRRDLDLIERFSSSYDRQFSDLIGQLNTAPTDRTAQSCLRLCMEAMHMMLASQGRIASALRHVGLADEPLRSAA